MNLWLTSGATYLTVSGRHTSPVPRIDFTTNRRTMNSLQRVAKWLHNEAELEVCEDDYRTVLVRAINPHRVSQSDRDTLCEILFGIT